MENNNKEVKYKGLLPLPLEPEDLGRVDPRIYSIRKGGVCGQTLYKWPHMYEAHVQTQRAEEFKSLLNSDAAVQEVLRLREELREAKEELGKEREESNKLKEQVATLTKSKYGALAYNKALRSQENSEKAHLLQIEVHHLKSNIDTLLAAKSEIEQENFKLREEIISREIQINQLKEAKVENLDELLESKYQELVHKYQVLAQNHEELIVNTMGKQDMIASQDIEISDLRKKLTKKGEEVKSLQNQLTELKKDQQKSSNQSGLIEGLSQKILELRREVSDLEAKLRRYQREYGILP